MRRRTVALLVMLLVLASFAPPASAHHTTRMVRDWKVVRNHFSTLLGRFAHEYVEDYAFYAMQNFDGLNMMTRPADAVLIEERLPLAPKLWTLKGESSGIGGRADIIGVYYDKDLRGGLHNWCSVYEIKSWNFRAPFSKIAQAQLIGYMEGIDEDPNMPCWGRRGTQWLPATYPTWHTIPAIYTPELAQKKIKLQITTTCLAGSPEECGLIWYRFQWENDQDRKRKESSAVRSDDIATAIWEIAKSRKMSQSVVKEYTELVAEVILDKGEVNEADADGFQQLIDIRRADESIDPYVTNARVVGKLVNLITAEMRANPYWLLGAANQGCPGAFKGREVSLCA